MTTACSYTIASQPETLCFCAHQPHAYAACIARARFVCAAYWCPPPSLAPRPRWSIFTTC